VPTILVREGQPVGGVKPITVNKGDQIRFRVVDDESEHLHVYGYDIESSSTLGNRRATHYPPAGGIAGGVTGATPAYSPDRGRLDRRELG